MKVEVVNLRAPAPLIRKINAKRARAAKRDSMHTMAVAVFGLFIALGFSAVTLMGWVK